MFEELDALDLADANAEVMRRIQEHREAISALGQYRAKRVAFAANNGRHGDKQALAALLDVSPQTISRLIGEDRKRREEAAEQQDSGER